MIFVTVGEQLPFDRLIHTMDEWGAETGEKIFAQIGHALYTPRYMEYKNFLSQGEFNEKLQESQVVVAHAGMGSIITALEIGKPIIVMPRRVEFGEHRNDHQLATAKRFSSLQYVTVALDENELKKNLAVLKKCTQNQEVRKIMAPSPLLIQTIRDFLVAT